MPRLIAGNYYAAPSLGSLKKRRTRARATIEDILSRYSGTKPEPIAVKESEEEQEQDEEIVNDPAFTQTFPTSTPTTVVRQTNGDLTCGMRSLQNLYGQHIVSREEMDRHASDLEKRSFGVQMYDKTLGYYHVEVLKSVLIDKGKYVQRVDPQKIPSDYFHSVLAMNPLFSGYIVALDSQAVKHYVTIRCTDENLRLIDSLPGVAPLDIQCEELFRIRNDGHVYCSSTCQQPVAAILAVGGSPFVEYQLMHDTWSANPPPFERYRLALKNILHHDSCREIATFQKAFRRQRCQPNEKTFEQLKGLVSERILNEWSIVVKKGDEQTIVRCRHIEDLLDTLCERHWIDASRDFMLEQDHELLTSKDGERVKLGATGPLSHFSIQLDKAITLKEIDACASHPQIGGFYQIDSSIQGTCVGTQHNAYSVRDDSGTMHVIYKGNVKRIQHIKR